MISSVYRECNSACRSSEIISCIPVRDSCLHVAPPFHSTPSTHSLTPDEDYYQYCTTRHLNASLIALYNTRVYRRHGIVQQRHYYNRLDGFPLWRSVFRKSRRDHLLYYTPFPEDCRPSRLYRGLVQVGQCMYTNVVLRACTRIYIITIIAYIIIQLPRL